MEPQLSPDSGDITDLPLGNILQTKFLGRDRNTVTKRKKNTVSQLLRKGFGAQTTKSDK